MNRLTLIFALLIPLYAYTQDTSGVVNKYYAVSYIAEGETNQVICGSETEEHLSSLKRGDKVLIMQMKGADFDRSGGFETIESLKKATNIYSGDGRHEYLAVQSVNVAAKVISFTANLKRHYNVDEKVQLIKILETDYVNVVSDIYPEPWDSAAGKGGVVAILALKKLTLNGNIDASGKGFKGATPVDYTGVCLASNDGTHYYKSGITDKGGRKGEGVLTDTFSFNIGTGYALNGGGGGYGKYGGGGGGSNYNAGGRGGLQSCGYTGFRLSLGGYALSENFYKRGYDVDSLGEAERFCLAMGGGGGSSTQMSSETATTGGNGGGIVIVLADSIVNNGSYSISANGESVTNVATAGGGGGGGGGTVVVDADYIANSFDVNINGGKGGDTDENTCSGTGGGGSGGVFWHNNTTKSSNINVDYDRGTFGVDIGGIGSCSYERKGTVGDEGVILSEYVPVLNGFYFNAVSSNDTICQGQVPKLIYGTVPKGVENFSYEWLSSPDSSTWSTISGEEDKDYQPEVLFTPTYYTRIVHNIDDNVYDTALAVRVHVWDSLENNTINICDTFCFGDSPGQLIGTVPNALFGGDGVNYSYFWERKTGSGDWDTLYIGQAQPEEGALNETMYYRRTVTSAKVCKNTSNIDTITVHPSIENNMFADTDSTICNGLDAGALAANGVTGGEGPDKYRYSWLVSNNDVDYSVVAGETSELYSPGTLSDNAGAEKIYYYKRIVYSGNDDACVDTTTVPRTITVLPSLVNTIETDSARYCYNDTPNLLANKELTGGDNSDYRIKWLEDSGTGWQEISGESAPGYQPPALTDSTKFTRRVISGNDDACIDTATFIAIDIIPAIENYIKKLDQDICQNDRPLGLADSIVGGGAGPGSYVYQWLQKTDNETNWSIVPGATAVDYSPPVLTDTTYYTREITSHICPDTSNEIKILVYPKIENNEILGLVEQYMCFNSVDTIFGSSNVDGGNGSYSYYWESSQDNSSWGEASGEANKMDYVSEALTTTYYFRRIVKSGDDDQCKDTTSSVNIKINLLPTGDIVSAIDTVCNGSEIEIAYSNLEGNGPWTIYLGESDSIYNEKVSSASGTLTFNLEIDDIDVVEDVNLKVLNIVDDSTCQVDQSTLAEVVKATIYEVPAAYAGEDFEACELSTILNAEASVGDGVWAITSGSGTFADSSLANSGVNVDDYGQMYFTWTETNWRECVDQDEVSVMFYEQPVEINAGEDIFLNYRFVDTLEATPVPAELGEGYWSLYSGNVEFEDSTSNETPIKLTGLGEHVVIWTNVNGVCPEITDSVLITIKELEVTQGLSPNGDGKNDILKIQLDQTSEIRMIIFDRYGREVRKIDDVDGYIEWDGTNKNGDLLPTDTYFYILKMEIDGVYSEDVHYIELKR